MLVDLVQVTTSDGLRLHGALEMPPAAGETQASGGTPSAVDAWLLLHGTGSNFYAASTLAGLAPKLIAGGMAVLRANTRGHDIISTGPSAGGRWLQGAAFERADEAPQDLAAWVEFLAARGFARIGILGHSLGAVKAIYALAAPDAANNALTSIAALVAVSPPRLSYSRFMASQRAKQFQETFALAEEHVRQGRGQELMFVKIPLPYYVTAEGYLDRYGPEERYNVLRLLDRVTCPTLVTYGSSEVQADMAFRDMPEEVASLATEANRLSVAVIAGADHIYTGCHDTLAGRVLSWTSRLTANG